MAMMHPNCLRASVDGSKPDCRCQKQLPKPDGRWSALKLPSHRCARRTKSFKPVAFWFLPNNFTSFASASLNQSQSFTTPSHWPAALAANDCEKSCGCQRKSSTKPSASCCTQNE